MDKKRIIGIWKRFAEGNDFMLNPNVKIVDSLAEGVLNNRKNHSLGYCPCRLKTGNPKEDLKLICPCNFRIQKTWKEGGECWCSLFVKRRGKRSKRQSDRKKI
ncbi:ferredoxin:thioredoxin reductase [Candidatus Woesearchaeota archaeon]|nr:ferredoxin:thioredoxin reductase [Candidatus Woesearchaeota archaeon]